MTSSGAKVFIQIESEAEQQAHLSNQRKTLRTIQGAANDKENKILTGRQQTPLDQIGRLKAGVSGNSGVLATPGYGKRKRVETPVSYCDSQTQTEISEEGKDVTNKPITVADLTEECEPGEHYYKRLAEKRRIVLEETLIENQHLHERIEGLEQELDTMRKELVETQLLVEVLKEVIESPTDNEDSKVEKSEQSDETCSNEDDDNSEHN